MWVNGRDLTDDSWVLTGLTGWMAAFPQSRGVATLPGVGGVIPDSLAAAGPRTIELTFERDLTTIASRDAALYTLADRLRGKLWVRFNDAPTRVVRCVAGPLTVEPMDPIAAFSVSAIRARVALTCYDGASYDTEPRILALATTPTEIPLGTLPSIARISWGGAWTATTARTLIWRDAGGNARTTMTFTAPTGESLSATDYLDIDTGRRYVTKVTASGARSNEYDWYTSGGWLVLDPAFQDRTGTRYATLEIPAGTAQITYRRAYDL